jgi:hypothetical protein
MFLTYSAVVLEKSLLVSQQKLQHLHGHTGNRLTYLTQPSRIPSFHSELFKHLLRRRKAWSFLFDAPNIIQNGFDAVSRFGDSTHGRGFH